jgi:hypothetical protein
MAYLRVYERQEHGGRGEWVALLDVTLHDDGKDSRFHAPGRAEALAFAAALDRRTLKLTVKELARRIVEDDLEGMRSRGRGAAVVQAGFSHLNVMLSAQFHYCSDEDLARGLREIAASVQEAGAARRAPRRPPEVF